jgi:beta-N-acetylhexosaminidase
MRKISQVLLAAFLIFFFEYNPRVHNGQENLAYDQFESAKADFNKQDYYAAARMAHLASLNRPDSAGPWVLTGHCFYLLGQDQAALFHYSTALQMDPKIGNLPPFLDRLRQGATQPQAIAKADSRVLRLLHKKIGQMIMVSVPGVALSGQKKTFLNAGWIGGVILFGQNVKSRAQITQYITDIQRNSPTPLFIAVDQEGGAVRRFREAQGFQCLPSQAALGQTQNADLAYRFGLLSGMQLKEVGANLNLAPVVDIDRGIPDSIITRYRRSLGSDPQMVSDLAFQIIRGMKAQNILATAKHFPTQSVQTANPHDNMAITNIPLLELEQKDLVPYRKLIEQNLLDAIMLSHVIYKNIDPDHPASLSHEMIQTLLRKKMGFQGLVISDDLRMDAIKQRYPLDVSVVQAVNAGVDILLVTDNMEKRVMDALVKAVQTGQVSMKTINESYQRIMAMKKKYGILTPAPGTAAAQAPPSQPAPNRYVMRPTEAQP